MHVKIDETTNCVACLFGKNKSSDNSKFDLRIKSLNLNDPKEHSRNDPVEEIPENSDKHISDWERVERPYNAGKCSDVYKPMHLQIL
ncbi:hypothetical protein CDAR_38101 [Caerostris darwini]|uniref:Uncharacterized protein n=1 Tax=Caerostris darwini TaxID=1538125 RepID=A0AAV4X071_9ARAC|nr:hypothetical protein CDAR_38101 [Caerostris darwini]